MSTKVMARQKLQHVLVTKYFFTLHLIWVDMLYGDFCCIIHGFTQNMLMSFTVKVIWYMHNKGCYEQTIKDLFPPILRD